MGGIPRVNLFWKAIQMSWSVDSDSTWLRLHKQEVYPHAFDPHKSNFESLSKAKLICKYPFWKDVYSSLIDCRLNILLDFPNEYKHIPINGETLITGNNNQDNDNQDNHNQDKK